MALLEGHPQALLRRPVRRPVLRAATRRVLAHVLLLLCVLGPPRGAVAAGGLDEYAVKAVFLYQFTQFVEWPPSAFSDATSPIVLGVLGEDPFGDSLRRATQGRTAQGRPIVVRQVKSVEQLRQCHVLFVSASEEHRIPDVLRTVGTAGVLTVGESPGFAEAGGTLNFIVDAARVRFEANVGAAERAGVRLSSKLLRVARIVGRRSR